MKKFWKLLDERCKLCHKALLARHKRLEGTLSDVAPILWQYGAYARLKSGETIDKLLHGGYSSISLGYAGMYECVKYLTGHSHSDGGIGEQLAIDILKKLNEYCDKWKKKDDIGYSIYGTPIESTTYKFAKCLKRRFGENIFIDLDGKDRDYITNSYHIPVFEKISAFDKLEKEAKFQELSLGGAISYIESTNMVNNIDAVLTLMQFMYEHIMYSEINTKPDYCQKCGYNGVISLIKDENNKYIWECPCCGNRDTQTMDIMRRTCGLVF